MLQNIHTNLLLPIIYDVDFVFAMNLLHVKIMEMLAPWIFTVPWKSRVRISGEVLRDHLRKASNCGVSG